MKGNRNLLGVLGIIAAAVIIYFGFFSPQPADDDLKATIGTVTKHQTEQITGEDVVLAGEETTDWSDDPVVVEAMASIMERATIAQRSYAYLAVGRQAQDKMLLAAGPEAKSAVLGKVAHADQSDAFKLLGKADQKAMYGRMGVKEGDFRAMSGEKKAAALGTLDAQDRSAIMDRVSVETRLAAVAKADPKTHSAILERASSHELARVYGATPEHYRVGMINSMSPNERQAMMSKVYIDSGRKMLKQATPVEMENLRNNLSEKNAADLYCASSVHDQLVWAGRAVQTSPSSFKMLGRAQQHGALGRLFLHATPEQKLAFFRAQPKKVQDDLYGQMSIKRGTWSGMDRNARAKALSGLSLERQGAMLARAKDKGAVIDLARHADPAIQKEFVGGLSRAQMSQAFKLGASGPEVHLALGRHAEIRNAVFTQTPVDVQVRIMGRMVRSNSPVR